MSSQQSVARGTCVVCGASVALRKDGSLRAHQNRAGTASRSIGGATVYPHCRGSDRTPAEAQREPCRVCLGDRQTMGYGQVHTCERCYGTGEEPSRAMPDERHRREMEEFKHV